MSDDHRRATDPFVVELTEIKLTMARIEGIVEKVEAHHRTLYGVNGEPGLTIFVDRLNENKKSWGMAWAAIIGLLIKEGWSFLTRK